MVSVRSFFKVDVASDWEIHQKDVHNAFLHEDLEEEVFIWFPPGFRSGYHCTQVCRFHKFLYDLKQAPRCWFAKLTKALKEYGFKQDESDYSLFTFVEGQVRHHVLVYNFFLFSLELLFFFLWNYFWQCDYICLMLCNLLDSSLPSITRINGLIKEDMLDIPEVPMEDNWFLSWCLITLEEQR